MVGAEAIDGLAATRLLCTNVLWEQSIKIAQGADPQLGAPRFYLVRAVLGTGVLSYDSTGAYQAGARDSEILASGVACP